MPPTITLDDLHRLLLPGMDAPSRLTFSPDGQWLAFLHAADGTTAQSLWRVDVRDGRRSLVAHATAGTATEETLDREEQLRRERARERSVGIIDLHWAAAPAGDAVLCASTAGGGVVVARGSASAATLDLVGVADPRLAPTGDALAWVRDRELWRAPLDVDGTLGEARRLSVDAGEATFNGLAEYVAAEELGRYRGFWWDAHGGAIAYAHVDERPVPLFHLQNLAAERLELEAHRYPFAGGPNARVTLRVVSLADGSTRDVDLGMAPDDYLARVIAEPSGGWLVAVLPRRQTSLRWLRVAPDGVARELWTETSEPWLNLDDDTRVLADGRIVRTTEASGFRHLVLRGPDGTPERLLTAGEWVVTGVAGVDETRGEVLFHATRHGVLERHLYAVPLDAPAPVDDPERRTIEPGWHECVVAPDGTWADRFSSVDVAPSVALHRPNGTSLLLHAATATPASTGRRPPELLTVTAADGSTELHAALYRPPATGTGSPPAVVWVYGGPHSQKVANAWELTVQPWRQLMTELGAAVLVVDNRGTAHRGLAFERHLHCRLGEVEVEDQLAAVDQLAARGLIDARRLAITGGSYGGFLTIRAMLRHPERFTTGVAWAPVVDWEGYDTAYTERYLGLPNANPDGYRSSSLRPEAGRLRGALLVQHGLVDENVHFRHTARLLDAFDAASVSCDLQVFPGERHSGRHAPALRARYRREVAHLARGLGLTLPEGWS